MAQVKLLLFFILVNSYVFGITSEADPDVADNQGDSGRDNESTAKTAILVTGIVFGLAAILCIGACGFCCYQKCCVEECII